MNKPRVWNPRGHQEIDPSRCEAAVSTVGMGFYDHQCKRKWKVEEEGHRWCHQHSPSALKAREEAEDKLWRDKAARRANSYKNTGLSSVLRRLRDAGHEDLATKVESALEKKS